MQQGSKIKRVTLLQVAKNAGVSQTTATLALRGSTSIRETTREKVFASMKHLGYIYDRVAANLRSKAPISTVGVIFADLGNPFYTELLIGILQELNKFGQTVILGTTFESYDMQDYFLLTMLEQRVGGIIMFPVTGTPIEPIARIKSLGIPVVFINRSITGFPCDYVGVDNVLGGQIAVEHLIRKGHRRIAFLGGLSPLSSWQARKKGYDNALHQAGLTVDSSLVIESDNTRQGGVEALQKLLNLSDLPTAAVCYNDTIAIGVMMEMREMGLIPGWDMAIVGFDGIPEGAIISPPLTTISSFPQLTGEYTARLLHERIEGLDNEPQSIILKPELIIRGSCSYKEFI